MVYLGNHRVRSQEGWFLIPVPSLILICEQVFPEITLHVVPDAGHSSREPGIAKLLVEVCTLEI